MSATTQTHPVLVIGSANRDYLVSLDALPAPGETVLAQHMQNSCGGKGANQAVAASRLGARTSFVGCVGDDPDGTLLLRELRAEGVGISDTSVLHGVDTGRAFVWVDRAGENSIAVVPGANFRLSPAKVDRVVRRAQPGTVLVLQAEIPVAVIEAAVAASSQTRVVLNLAPVTDLSSDAIRRADPLVLNAAEATALTGIAVRSPDDALRAAQRISPGPRSIVVTIGAGGAVWSEGALTGVCAAQSGVQVVDTTGAGDAFVGALASALAHSAPLSAAVAYGVRGGSFSVTRSGAQASYARVADLGAPSVAPTA